MVRTIAIVLTSVVFVSLNAEQGFGQSGGTGAPSLRRNTRPTTSPYLDLLRNNTGGIGAQYYRSVRPEMEFRRNASEFRRSLGRVQRQVDDQQLQFRQSGASGLTPSGHTTRFLNYGGYYTFYGQNR